MCGINGALVFKNSAFEVTPEYITLMRDTMAHRGPDGAGAWVAPDRKLGLGHRRLAIIDLSEKAAQPMSNEDGSLWMVFNGEIYNHAEIRSELEQIGGHTWRTDHSDAEVIVHAFEQWGIGCLCRFRGMFAIALWDDQKKELWLVRDRLGIKPLYYSVHDNRLVFASEIKALLEDPDQKREVDETAFFHYLSFLATPPPQTIFQGIKKLPAGTWLKADEFGNIQTQSYWDIWDKSVDLSGASEDDIANLILRTLRESVRLRKVSDVPVGVFLSGGIDSSVNTALFAEGEQKPIKTFTIGYHGNYSSYQNEMHYAHIMAERVGAEHHEKLLDVHDLLDFLPEMVWLQDEPIADPVCVPLYYLARLAREHGVIVCQVGEGSDELFCGYPAWKQSIQAQALVNHLPLPKLVMFLYGLTGFLPSFADSVRRDWLRRAGQGLPIFWGGAEAFTDEQKLSLLGGRLRSRFKNFTSWSALAPLRGKFLASAPDSSALNWMTYLDLHLRLPELLLMRMDKMSMAVSLEGRVPFLDHKFVELAMSIPPALKLKNGILKYMLKKAVHGIIPDELIDRSKQGFGVPIYEWFFKELGARMSAEFREFCKETDFFDRQEIDRLISRGRGPKLWFAFNFVLWWNRFIRS